MESDRTRGKEFQQQRCVVNLLLDRGRRTQPRVERELKVCGIEAGVFPVNDGVDLQRVRVDDDVVQGEIIVTEDTLADFRV